jgi:hypothetical protein
MSIEDKQERTSSPPGAPVAHDLKDDPHASPTPQVGQAGGAGDMASNTRKSRVPKRKGQEADVDGPARQTNAVAKPARKSRAAAKVSEVTELAETDPSTPKRTRRRTSTSADATRDSKPPAVHSAASDRPNIPPVTEEAIQFLANPDAKVPDLVKLQPQSREFVMYHVSNMQKLDADIALGRSYLARHMPKFSPEFERAADALVANLAKRGHAKSSEVTQRADKSTSAGPSLFYGPTQASGPVQLHAPVRLLLESRNHKVEAENSIERGPLLALDKQPIADVTQPTLTAQTNGRSMPGLGKKVLQVMGSTAQVAGAWLHSKSKSAETSKVDQQPVAPDRNPAPADDRSSVVPSTVTRRFLKVEQDYYFPDKTPAFSDRGDKLATRGAHPEVVRSLVEIAQARGWASITVKGAEEFRRSAWMEAAQAGLKVAGYQPSALDLAELANRPANNTVEKGRQRDLGKTTAALSAQQPGPGPDQRAAEQRDNAGTAPRASPQANAEFTAKASAFAKERPSLVLKHHPELAPAYGVVDVAKKFAEAHLPEDAREEFVGLARRHVIQKIVTGESVKGPKIYVEHAKSRKANEQTSAVAKESIDQGKSPRAKEVAKER